MVARRPKHESTTGATPRKSTGPALRLVDAGAWQRLREKTVTEARQAVRDEGANVTAIENAVRSYFGVRKRVPTAREAADVAAARALVQLRQAIENLRATGAAHASIPDDFEGRPLVGPLANLRHYVREHGLALDFVPRTVPRAEPPEWPAIDLVLAQLWQSLNGGHDRCRVCDAKLSAQQKCQACGAEPPFSNGTPSRGALWWRGKARPRDLAVVLLLAGRVTDAEWKAWAAEGATSTAVRETLANRIRTRLGELRKGLRERRLKFVRADPSLG